MQLLAGVGGRERGSNAGGRLALRKRSKATYIHTVSSDVEILISHPHFILESLLKFAPFIDAGVFAAGRADSEIFLTYF